MTSPDPAQAYAALRDTYRTFAQAEEDDDADAAPLFEPVTTRRLLELFDWLVDPDKEAGGPPVGRVAALLSWTHWARWRHSDDPRRGAELDRALVAGHLLPGGEGAPPALQPLIRLGHRAMLTRPPDPALLQDYAGMLVLTGQRYGCAGALAEGVRRMAAVVEQLPEDDPVWAVAAANLCAAVLAEQQTTGASDHVGRAVDRGRVALSRLEAPDGELARWLVQFGRLLLSRSARSGVADVDEAIEVLTRASGLGQVPADVRGDVLTLLGTAWYRRHLSGGRPGDLDRAIDVLSGVLPAPPCAPGPRDASGPSDAPGPPDASTDASRSPVTPGSPDAPGSPGPGVWGPECHGTAAVLASAWSRRGALAGSTADLRHAVDVLRVLARERGDVDDHVGLATALERLYQSTGRAELLDEAVRNCERAGERAEADGSPSPAALAGLAWVLKLRYENLGDDADRDRAVAAARRSVALTPDGHDGLGRRLAVFAAALATRAMATGSTPDLEEGLAVIDRALALPGEPDADRAIQLVNKSALLAVRYGIGGDLRDIAAQIDLCRAAVDLVPDGNPKKGVYRANAMGAHLELHLRTGDRRALEEALALGELALTEIPGGDPRRVFAASNQAVALTRMAETEYDEDKLHRAVRLLTEALELRPEGQAPDARLLVNRGSALALRGRPEDLERALRDWRTAALFETASPAVRMTAAIGWAEHSAEAGRWDVAADAYTRAVELLTSVAGLQLDPEDRAHRLTDWGHVTSEAVAAALQTGDPDKALELFEAGRCVQWKHQVRNAGELSLLADAHPALAAEVERVTGALGVLWYGRDTGHLADPPPPRPAGADRRDAGGAPSGKS